MHSLSDNFSRSVQLARLFLRTPRRIALTLAAATGLSFIAGCFGSVRGPVIDATSYDGPAITIDSSQREHIAAITAPTGGWRCTLDQVRDAYRAQRVFITLRRPNPALYNTQALVEQRIGTTVPRDKNVEVFARVIAFDDLSPETPYRAATKADGNPTPLPPRQREKRDVPEAK